VKPDKHSESWLFQKHKPETVQRWVQSLHYFTFYRAAGGHANDGDMFTVTFEFGRENDCKAILQQLGLTTAELKPGPTSVFGRTIFLQFNPLAIEISVSGSKDGNYYEVSDEDFKTCMELEQSFEKLNLGQFISRKQNNICLITPDRYPELWN
jgi:hypothetical protein